MNLSSISMAAAPKPLTVPYHSAHFQNLLRLHKSPGPRELIASVYNSQALVGNHLSCKSWNQTEQKCGVTCVFCGKKFCSRLVTFREIFTTRGFAITEVNIGNPCI